MLEAVIQDQIRQQRPYYLLQGNSVKGVGGQYWLVFRHRDAEQHLASGGNFLKNIVSLLGFKDKAVSHKVIRIDPSAAKVYTYNPRTPGDLPSPALLRTGNLKIIEQFFVLERTTKEPALLSGSFREIKGIKRRYNLPIQLDTYNKVTAQMLERSSIYRRSTAYFDSGVLKLYEEPLQTIVQTEGQIRLLMDWQGFTKRADVAELERLHNSDYRAQFIQRTLREFLEGLEESAFNGTQIMAELVRLGFLEIKLIKMSQDRSLYHKKTGIYSDRLNNHILHEGSDNFTLAAHSRNAESVTFLWSWGSQEDQETIEQSIQEFDSEWHRQDLACNLTQEFLQQVLQECDRRSQQRQPRIEQITPDELPPGETTEVKITGDNLDQVDTITIPDNPLVEVNITAQTPEEIAANVTVSPDHPPQRIPNFRVKDSAGSEYNVQPQNPPKVPQVEELPNFDEIEGFQQAVELILAGKNGTPNDFLYWLAQQRPRQFRVEQSDLLDELVNQGTLFEHQKSGAQHCLRVMQDFGVAVCADAVGLGKTRLAAAVARLSRQRFEIEQGGQAKVAIIAAKKLHDNWKREMGELGFRDSDYELYNKNLMSRKGTGFIDDFNRYGGPDLVIIDEAHEGIRNYKNRVHKLCLQIRDRDRASGRQRNFLLLTATPWNNRREDIYNILQPFLTRPEGFTDSGFPPELAQWFQNRETGVEQFTDDSALFRRTYRELFLQRTRQMLRDAMPDLNVYAKRQAEWLPVQFENSTEQALEQIFTQFETQLYIPFADPIRYLTGSVEQRALLQNQRRFFLQRAESSMYALKRTIVNFRGRIEQMQSRLGEVTADAGGLKQFLLLHYGFESGQPEQLDFDFLDDREAYDEDYEEEDDDDEDTVAEQQEKRQQLRRTIDLAIERLQSDPNEARRIYALLWSACDNDLMQLQDIQDLLADEFIRDHKREQVTAKVRELVSQGRKVLLISTFSDTVLDYYRYMAQDSTIVGQGIGMAIGGAKRYFPDSDSHAIQFAPHNAVKAGRQRTGIKRLELFRLFAPIASCRNPGDRPSAEDEVKVLIGSETLSVGQNLQDADYLINIDLPWNPMTLEQRIGRIDRPKQHKAENIYIYYANSESQLLRQASRLSNLNKKLIGADVVNQDGTLQDVPNINDLGASIYGDTLFDDTILPGYVDFIRDLVVTRRQTQENFQEKQYRQQETSRDLYTQQEILFSEDISQRLKALGDDYQANPIALGRRTGEKDEPIGLAALSIQYFGPNGEPIPDRQELVFWNDQTVERDAYGIAISTAFKTPEAGDVFSARYLRSMAQTAYTQLVALKNLRAKELSQMETIENVTVTSERLNKIQQRISTLDSLPDGLDRKTVKDTLRKLNTWKNIKSVQKLLRDYTDGAKAQLETLEFVTELVKDTDEKNLILSDGIRPTKLSVNLLAILLRA
ncbi:helicase [Limnothrix sp. PR1529]|uniref:helicase-related protein n=1 Tax=Limnothrix sp. PR1529 TaxID=1704291 RepID=UPI00081D7D9D|nr:helicase-related protein [Limnothrix sp. PR1529]OCQ92570.1 helicase [Limnothrix sp. P13C2]PIB09980.1 helicase [Limnothrix sp. PR1529]